MPSYLITNEGDMNEEISFKSRHEFRKWLSTKNLESRGVWIVFSKDKESKFTAYDALEEALSFGWIDGLIKKINDKSYKKYFSPRKKGSRWSDKNKKIIEELIKKGEMAENGLLAIQRAKEDGSWDIEDRRNMGDDKYVLFESKISANIKAYHNYVNMPQSIKKQFVGLYNEPKREETKEKRLLELLHLLEENIKPMDKYKK